MITCIVEADRDLRAALNTKNISRTAFNRIRRCGVLLDDEQMQMWNALNDGIWSKTISIIEDGDTIFEVALSFADGHVNRVMSL